MTQVAKRSRGANVGGEESLLSTGPGWTRDGLYRSPERRLLVAILMQALHEFRQVAGTCHPEYDPRMEELKLWFFGHSPDWPFAFESICDQLDLNPECIRERLAAVAHIGLP